MTQFHFTFCKDGLAVVGRMSYRGSVETVIRSCSVAQARGDQGLDETRLVKMEKHEQTKNTF